MKKRDILKQLKKDFKARFPRATKPIFSEYAREGHTLIEMEWQAFEGATTGGFTGVTLGKDEYSKKQGKILCYQRALEGKYIPTF